MRCFHELVIDLYHGCYFLSFSSIKWQIIIMVNNYIYTSGQMIREIIPKWHKMALFQDRRGSAGSPKQVLWPYFRLVNYYNLPR